MKRYVCPVCEHELTAKSYCPECRRIIRKPWVYEGYMPNEYTGGYLLNHSENHHDGPCIEPNRSRTCETPQERRQDQQFTSMQSDQTVYQKFEGKTAFETRDDVKRQNMGSGGRTAATGTQSTAPGSQIWKTTGSGSGSYSGRTYRPNPSRSGKRAEGAAGCGCGCLIAVIAFILFVIGIVSSVDMNMDDWLELFEDASISVDLGDDFLDDNWEEIDYSDVILGGVRCDGYWHYPISGKALYDELVTIAEKEMGLVVTDTSEYMDNGILHDSDYGDITYYDTYQYWDWADGYIGVVYDTFSEEVHFVTVYGLEPKEVLLLGIEALRKVETGDLSAMYDTLSAALEGEDVTEGKIYNVGNSSIWVCQDSVDEAYRIEISPVSE